MKPFLRALLPCLFFLAACEKDPRYMSPQKYLSQAPWKLAASTAITFRTNGTTDTANYYGQLDSCRQDLRYTYGEDGSYFSQPGPKVCPGLQPLQREDLGRWRYLPETKQLLIDGAGRLTWDILVLSDSNLNLRIHYTIQDDAQVTSRTEERNYMHTAE